MSISLFALAFVSVWLLATDSFTVSDFESFPSSSRTWMLFSPAVGVALVLPAVGVARVLLAVGYAFLAVLEPVLLSSFFSPTGSLTMVPISASSPLALWVWFCLCFLQRHFVVVYDSVARFCHLQHHYSALSHFVIVVSL